MKAMLMGLVLVAGIAHASCPKGIFVPSEGGTYTGNTCGHGNDYRPQNATLNLGADDGYVWIAPAGPYQITFTGFAGSIDEVRDLQDGTCTKAVYGACRINGGGQTCVIDDNSYTGFDAPRWLGVFVDSLYRGCGSYTLTIGPYVESLVE